MSSSNLDEQLIQESLVHLEPMDLHQAELVLKEAKGIFDRLGVVFYLEEGTCLGAIRDHGFIPWDDDIDLGSIFGMHGFTDKNVMTTVAAFKEHGFLTKIIPRTHYLSIPFIKGRIRIDWHPSWVFDDHIFHYPGSRFPLRLFRNLKEINFLGTKFLVPNPPEEFLELKYGPDWVAPKKSTYGTDVIRSIPHTPISGRRGRISQFVARHVHRQNVCKIRVLNIAGKPVDRAEVTIVGVNRSKTDQKGYVRFTLPKDIFYALIIRHGEHEEVLYEEKLESGNTYVYTPDPTVSNERYLVLKQEQCRQ